MMTKRQYQIPKHLCQWCFEHRGRFMMDCMCIVCQECFERKLNWQNEPNMCAFCNKGTTKKFIDLRLPQSTNYINTYFGNPQVALTNSLKALQFQTEISKKYCKHLEAKVKKYEEIIQNFIQMVPQHKDYFEKHLDKRRNKPGSVRSKSSMATSNVSSRRQILQPSLSERDYQSSFIDPNGSAVRGGNFGNSFYPETSRYEQPDPQRYQQPQNPENTKSGKMSKFSTNSLMPKGNPNPNLSKVDPRYEKNSRQQPPFKVPMYKLGENKIKKSNPERQRKQVPNINLQTAMRSIRSDQNDSKRIPEYLQQSYKRFQKQADQGYQNQFQRQQSVGNRGYPNNFSGNFDRNTFRNGADHQKR